MPRGVPRNRERAQHPAATVVADTSVASGAAHTAGEPAPAEVETPPQAPVPVAELTPEQVMIRELRNQLALERGKKDVEQELDPVAQPGSADNIVIHFLEDGFSALGEVWYRGQEIEFEVGSKSYRDTFNRLGQSWLDLRLNEFAQVERWGRIMFRPGPWPGKSLADAKVTFQTVKNADGSIVAAPTAEELAKAAAAEAKRRRAAPRLQSISA